MSQAAQTMLKTHNDITEAAKKSLPSYGSKLLIIEKYAMAVQRQPEVALGGLGGDKGTQLQNEINATLKDAGSTANGVLNAAPKWATTILSVGDFFGAEERFLTGLGNGDSVDAVRERLRRMRKIAEEQKKAASGYAESIAKARDAFNGQAKNFATFSSRLNELIAGEKGALEVIDGRIKTADATISSLNGSIALNAVKLVGGGILVVIGLCTGGLGLLLVAGGVALAVKGGLDLADDIAKLRKAHQDKAAAIADKAKLRQQLTVAEQLAPEMTSLHGKASDAADAAQGLYKAWESLAVSLEKVRNDINEAGDVKSLKDFLVVDRGDIKAGCVRAKESAKTIHSQVIGAETRVDTTKPVATMMGK